MAGTLLGRIGRLSFALGLWFSIDDIRLRDCFQLTDIMLAGFADALFQIAREKGVTLQ